MRYKISAALLLFLGGAVLVFAGAGFACYAIYANLLPAVGDAAAATITAVILLAIPAVSLVLLSARARRQKKNFLERLEEAAAQYEPPPNADQVTVAFLAGLARDKPLTAMLLSIFYGASSTLYRKKK